MKIIVNGRTLDYPRPTISYKTATMLALYTGPFITYKLSDGTTGTLEEGDVIAVSEGLVLSITERTKHADPAEDTH